MSNKEGPPLVPLERVAVPTVESTDKATRKMIARVNKVLTPRLPLQTTGNGISLEGDRFVEMVSPVGPTRMLGHLRVSDKNAGLPADKPLRLVSGMCMFGAEGLMGTTKSGRLLSLTDPRQLAVWLADPTREPIEAIQELSVLHPSETEAMLLAADSLKALSVGETSVFFHQPKTEYKLYMLEPFQQGLLTADQVNDLFARIDKRAEALTKILAKRIQMPKSFGSPLAVLEPVLDAFGAATTIEQCLEALRAEPLMDQLIKLHQFVPIVSSDGAITGVGQQPPKFTDLNELSYTAGYLGVAQQAAASQEGFLAVDLCQEKPIFEHSEKLLPRLGVNFPLNALLLPPALMTVSGRYGRSNLFMHQSNGQSSLIENKLVVANRRGLVL